MKRVLSFEGTILIQLKFPRCVPAVFFSCIVFLLALSALEGDLLYRPLFLASHTKLLAGSTPTYYLLNDLK